MTRSGKSSNCVINAIEYQQEEGMIVSVLAVFNDVHRTEIFAFLYILTLNNEQQSLVQCDRCH
jgi:hypothetical protein